MRQRRYGSLVGVAAVTALLAGCQGGGAPALSLAGLTRTADAVPREGQASCPLAYDMAEAAKAAGAPGAAAPGSVKAPGAAVATSEGASGPHRTRPWHRTPAPW